MRKINENNQDLRIEFLYKRFEELDKDSETTDNVPHLDEDGMYLFFMFIHSLISRDPDQELFALEVIMLQNEKINKEAVRLFQKIGKMKK